MAKIQAWARVSRYEQDVTADTLGRLDGESNVVGHGLRRHPMRSLVSVRTALVIGIVVVVGSAAAAFAVAGSSDDTTRPITGGWPEDTDRDGIVSDSGSERIPEYIRAVGDNGKVGYVRFKDLDGPQPSSPEEAVKMSGESRTIPLYADDLVTVIDTYTLTGSSDGATGATGTG